MKPKLLPNYTQEETEALVEGWSELRHKGFKLNWLVRYWDLDLALRDMPPKEYHAVLLIGLLGIDTRTAGRILGVSHQTAWTRYQRGLEWLTNHMNGRSFNH